MGRVQFGVLGAIEVRRDGESLSLGGPKQRALLAFLLLHANQPVSRDRLLEALWGEHPPARGDATLDTYLSRLRKLLGVDRLMRTSSGYALRVEPEELDLDLFERLVHASRFDDALALWRGPALADILYEPFATAAAGELDERRLFAVEQRLEARLACGEGPELVAELDRLAREHPFRERLIAQQAVALYRAGRQSDALAVIQGARRRLNQELGLELGPGLRDLERRILQHDPTLRTSAGPAAGLPRPSRRSLAVVCVLSAAVLVGVLLLVIAGGSAGPRLNGTTDALVAVRMVSSTPIGVTRLASSPGAATAGAGRIWIASPSDEDVTQIDPRSGSVVDRINVGGEPADVVSGDGAIWVASTLGAKIERIDPATDAITQTIQLQGANPYALAFGNGRLWVADPTDQSLLDINPSTGSVERTFSLDVSPSSLTFGAGAIWVASYNAGEVEEVSRSSGVVLDTVHVGNGPADLKFGLGAVWAANSLDGTVSRIDPETVSVTATIPVGSGPSALAVGGGAVWVADEYSRSVSRIDPTRNTASAAIQVGGRPGSLAVSKGRLWVGDAALGHSHRGGTLRLLTTEYVESFDPAFYNVANPPESVGLVYDGLVTFERAAGPAGLRLVPDLALRIPEPSDDARTYAFQLRPGIRYSDGRLLRADDFRRAFERDFRVRSPGIDLFSGIEGASTCLEHAPNCSLVHGVVADDANRTVTIHLTAPDPDFLFKLTEYAYTAPIPVGTPDRELTTETIPGTGPYRIASAGPSSMRFARNRFFHEWSHAAQPEGNPNAITLSYSPTHAHTVASILAGTADWTYDLIPPPDLRKLELHDPGLLHSNPSPYVEFIPINTHRAPFDDVRARQSLNLALNRGRIAAMYGGPQVATPTCQPLTPGIPGYRRYCPYTQDPRPNGGWTAPNLTRARQLVAESGTRGERVDVWGTTDEIAVPREEPAYVAAVLRSLGYRTRLHLVPESKITPAMRRKFQLSVDGDWGAEYPDPSSYIPLFFGCRGGFSNGYYCNPTLDQRIHEVTSLETQSPMRAADAWTSIDRYLTNQAIWAPTVDLRAVELVSPRVRNYQFNPVWGFLADQVWLR